MITIDEHYTIKPDAFCWQLLKEQPTGKIHEKTNEEIISRDTWYHATIQDALRRYVTESSKTSTNYSELMEKLNSIESNILKVAKTIKKD